MTLRTVAGRDVAEGVDDLASWLRALQGCPPVTHTVVAACRRPVHGDEPATWFYLEADARAGVARTRCLACGDARPVLDSALHWTFPPAWSCFNCNQSIGEVVFGVHADADRAAWLVVGVRCVNCGHLAGVTDMTLPEAAPVDELLAAL